jgi:Siphovirus ReqiPepy6 Gp37-like protein
MDVIKLTNPTDKTKMEQGIFVEGITSKMWIEKYRDASEFTFTAPIDSGVKEMLPLDTYVTHMNTGEIMIVENHEINETSQAVPEVKITGRSLEVFLEERIVGSNKSLPQTSVVEYILPADYTWNQAQKLINEHAVTPYLVNLYNSFPYLRVPNPVIANVAGALSDRNIPYGQVYSALTSLLAVDDLGIKVVRPGHFSPLTGDEAVHTAFVIHAGVDRSKEVIFSYNTGEITSADYLWSIKTLKNSAFVSGTYVQTQYDSGPANGYRRIMFVDGTSVDKGFPSTPVGIYLDQVVAAMQFLGAEAISTQNKLVMSKAEVRKDATKAIYRKDFDLGDIIMVDGDYDEAQAMRVTEYVEIEDGTGESGYPTLTVNSQR